MLFKYRMGIPGDLKAGNVATGDGLSRVTREMQLTV
jgi:hypothetical protein